MKNEELGFTRLPNYVLEKIILSDFSKRQLKIIFYLCRLQFGFHRAKVSIKNSDFRLCGIRESVIKKELNELIDSGVIERSEIANTANLNLQTEDWKIPLITNIEPNAILELRNKVFSKQFKRVPDLGNLLAKEASKLKDIWGIKKSKEI